MQTGTFPNKLKKSRTVPVFKAGATTSCDNYRPIALLSTLSKILEKIVCNSLTSHLDSNNILYEHQFGFQKHKSTEHNLTHAINYIGKAFNENKFCLGIFFDLKKAFDVCSHDILLMKLEKMGIRGTSLNWFRSYLSNRVQVVDINGNLSKERKIKISILQGSILGPILFLCYINDLFRVTDLLTLMFADDTFSLKSDSGLFSLINHANIEINKMAVWFKANKLAVNINKTKYMIFRTKGKKLPPNLPELVYNENEPNLPQNQITILERYHNGHQKTEARAYKLLGIYLDEHISLDFHVNHLLKKLSRSLYCIKAAKNNLNTHSMKSLYYALVHSHLTYCPVILNCSSNSNITKLFKLQKKAIRIISNSNYNAHTAPLFLQHKILPIHKIIKQAKLTFMHSVHYNYAPLSFHDTWQLNHTRHNHHILRNDDDYALPNPRIEQFKRFPIYSLPAEWNQNENLTHHGNPITFKRALKNLLFEELSIEMPADQ